MERRQGRVDQYELAIIETEHKHTLRSLPPTPNQAKQSRLDQHEPALIRRAFSFSPANKQLLDKNRETLQILKSQFGCFIRNPSQL